MVQGLAGSNCAPKVTCGGVWVCFAIRIGRHSGAGTNAFPLMRRKTANLIIVAALLVPAARAQEATKVCADGRTIKIASQWDQLGLTMAASDVAAQPLRYSISSLEHLQGAWIEIWDRPKRLSRQPVPVRLEGQAPCTSCLDAGETPRELRLWIFDADEPLLCIDYCAPGTPMNGAYVSELQAGKQPEEDYDESEKPAYLIDYAGLTGDPIRMLEGSGSTNVVLSGENLIQSSRVYVVDENALPKDKASPTYLYSRTPDLRHVEVTIPSDLLKKPGVLMLYAKDSWEAKDAELGKGQKIIVASKDSPVIDSIEPNALRCCESRESDVTVVLRGRGFTEHSEVIFEDDQYAHSEVTFVSSHELRVTIPGYKLKSNAGYATRATPLMLTVENAPLQLSAPAELPVLPSAEFKRDPLPAAIRAITPYPVPMMDFRSPELLTLDISGDNFRPNDFVAVSNGESDRIRLKTQFVSSHHLRAWLPRESWRKHLVSFRFIIQTSAGLCATEAFAESLE